MYPLTQNYSKSRDEAESKITRLKKEEEEIRQVIKPLKSLSSLIRRFPREVMELIFIHSIPTTVPGRSTFNICQAPLVLLRVCKMWREIALTTPRLWASVEPSVPAHLLNSGNTADAKRQQRIASLLEQFDQWLGRSKNYPLSIVARGSPLPSQSDENTIVQGLASKLVAHSRRWESVHFDVSQQLPSLFTDIVTESLPALKHLRFSAHPLYFSFHDKNRYHALLAAPNLKKLQMQVSDSSLRYSKLPVNWSNLTHLSLDFSHMDHLGLLSQSQDIRFQTPEILLIMKQCQKLRILSLLLTSAPNPLPEEAQVTLSSLEALNVSGCRSQIHHLLQSIMTPRIREIHYQPLLKPTRRNEAPPLIDPTLPLTSFLQRHGNQIEVLSIDFHSVSREDLQTWLECTPALKQLTLGREFQLAPPPYIPWASTDLENAFDDSCIELLTPDRNKPWFCPNLKVFRCSIQGRISGDTILAFLKARSDPLLVGDGGIVEELLIHQLAYDFPFGDSIDAEDERLRPIREAGVRLSFKKSPYYQSSPSPTMVDEPLPGIYIPGFGPGYGVDFKLF